MTFQFTVWNFNLPPEIRLSIYHRDFNLPPQKISRLKFPIRFQFTTRPRGSINVRDVEIWERYGKLKFGTVNFNLP